MPTDAVASSREALRELSALTNRMEQLRGRYLQVSQWNLPIEEQEKRLKGFDEEAQELVLRAKCCSVPEMSGALTDCRERLETVAHEARTIVEERRGER